MKTCFKCGETKPMDAFYRHSQMKDGHLSKCKDCTRKDVKANRDAKADYYREYDRKRFQEDPRVRERHQQYRKTAAGSSSISAAQAKWISANPEKRAAHNILGNAVRDGNILKPERCSMCGTGGRIEGHHEDYSKPLEVIWLCPQCHVDTHKGNINANQD